MADNKEETKPAESANASPEQKPADAGSATPEPKPADAASSSQEATPADAAAAGEEPPMTEDQSFTYWLVMLPFLVTGAVFIYRFSQTPGEYKELVNAIGAVIVGLFVATAVNIVTQNGNKVEDEAKPADEKK
jgi:hypothetical protein